MATNDISIINEALALIGVPSIATLQDNINAAKVASQMYGTARDALLRMHTWGFATQRAALTEDTAPAFGTEKRYLLPTGCLRVVELYSTTTSWTIEGMWLLTDDASAQIKYIYRETDTTKYDALFTEAFIYYLASRMAYPLTRSRELAASIHGDFLKAFALAKGVDANEDAPIELISRALLILGAPPLADRDDSRTQIAIKIYENARDEVLAAHPWNFAIKRSGQLSAGTGPLFGYTNAWTLPADCLRVLEVYDSVGVWYSGGWDIEAGQLISDMDNAPQIRYIFRNTSTTNFSAHFTNALMYNLASKLAGVLVNQPTLVQPNYDLYVRAIAEARLTDDKEGGSDIVIAKSLALLGVTSLDGHKTQLAIELYEDTRDEVLRMHTWNFAVKYDNNLSNSGEAGDEYSYNFGLPADCIRAIELVNAGENTSFRIRAQQLLTNANPARLKYVARITDTTKFEASFTNCVVFLLASKLAYSATQQPALGVQYYEMYQKTLLAAKAADMQEGTPEIIVSRALLLIGIAQISLVDDGKITIINSMYATCRDEVLRAHTWNFAVKRSGALATTTAPNFGYTYAYTLPSDCLRVVELYNSTSPWRVENSVLLTNDTVARVKYVAQITDTTKFNSSFMNALVYNLASKLAFPIANQSAVTQQYYEIYKNTLNEARLIDSMEGVPVTDIVNQSLALIGVSSIAALDDNQIRVVEKLYTPTLKETMADHEWNFAISRAALVEALPVPDFGYAHKFTLPADCLRVTELYDSDSEWKIEGSYLMTDDESAKIIYIAYVTDTTKFSPLFTTALMYHLASKFAVPMTKDKGLQKQNYELYRATIDNARSVDSREGTADDITSNILIDVRR